MPKGFGGSRKIKPVTSLGQMLRDAGGSSGDEHYHDEDEPRERSRDNSGSSGEENSTFLAVCKRVGMTQRQRGEFHTWLHSNHGIDGQTTDMKFNELLPYAEDFIS